MILPGSYLFSLILLIISLLCLGSWANSIKMAGPKWRFELYYFDFAIGAMIAALIVSFTFGSLGLDGFTVMDDLRLAGRRHDAFAFLAGCIFNLGNLMLVAAISLAGMSVAVPICLGMALIAGSALGYVFNPAGSGVLLLTGCATVLAAIAFNITAFRKYTAMKIQAAAEAAAALAAERTAEQKVAGVKAKKPLRKRKVTGKLLILGILGGVLLGAFRLFLDMAVEGEDGLGPYCAALIFVAGMMASTFVYNLFFMNLPVQGAAVEIAQYFTGKIQEHLTGMAGGMLWFCGMLTAMLVVRADATVHIGPALITGLGEGSIVIGTLWGLLAWRDFSDAESNVKLLLGATLALLVIGIGVVSVAPLYGTH